MKSWGRYAYERARRYERARGFFFFRVTHDELKSEKGATRSLFGAQKRKQILALGLCEFLSLKIRSQRVSSIKRKSGRTKLWLGVQSVTAHRKGRRV